MKLKSIAPHEHSQSTIRFMISFISTPTSVPTTCKIDNNLYVASEYIAPDEDGFSTLDDRLRLGKIPLEKQLRWSAEFCFAMRHACIKGLVAHRDLKPSNLMLDNGSLKITDFGLSK